MAYIRYGETWPQLDSVTNRVICGDCWNQHHESCGNVFDEEGLINCDHKTGANGTKKVKACKSCTFECDCHHLSEASFAAIERAESLGRRRAKKKLMADMLADEANPLRARNPEVERKQRLRGKRPA